jgi:hypothetical protein
VLPTGWEFVESGSNANTDLRVHTGATSTGDTHLFGATGSNERAFGSFASGSLQSQFGAQFMNNTGVRLDQFTLSYIGEQWKDGRSSSAVQNTLTFAFSVDATSLTSGTFTTVPELAFAAPVGGANPQTGSDVSLDGNLAANQSTISFTVTGVTWEAGQSLWIRWSDVNESGNDDGLAIDGLSFSASISSDTTPPTITSLSPADNATNVLVGTNLVATFSEPVAKGTGSIEIRKTADNSVVETIPVSSASVAVSGATVTINPASDLDLNTEY